MKQILLILAVVVVVGCVEMQRVGHKGPWVKVPRTSDRAVAGDLDGDGYLDMEEMIRRMLRINRKLTKADYEKVTDLDLRAVYDRDGRALSTVWTELPKGLEKLTQLRALYLLNNKLTSVKGLEKLTKLERLHLENNKLTEAPKGLEKLTKLRVLNLRGNKLTSVKGLEKYTQLKALVLDDNPDLTKAQIDELHKALPKCKIIGPYGTLCPTESYNFDPSDVPGS